MGDEAYRLELEGPRYGPARLLTREPELDGGRQKLSTGMIVQVASLARTGASGLGRRLLGGVLVERVGFDPIAPVEEALGPELPKDECSGYAEGGISGDLEGDGLQPGDRRQARSSMEDEPTSKRS